MKSHLSDTTILQFIFQEVDDPTRLSQIKEHLAQCVSCHETFKEFKKISLEAEHSSCFEVPEHFISQLIQTLPPQPFSSSPRFRLLFLWGICISLLFFLLLFRSFWSQWNPISSPEPFQTKLQHWLDPQILGISSYFQLVKILKNEVVLQDEEKKQYTLKLGETMLDFRLSILKPNQIVLSGEKADQWILLREKDFFAKKIFTTEELQTTPALSIESVFAQLRKQEATLPTGDFSKKIFHYVREQQFEEWLQHPSSPEIFELFEDVRDESWWWAQWLKQKKIPFIQLYQKLGSTPSSFVRALTKLAPEQRAELYTEFPSLEFCYTLIAEVPAFLKMEWVPLLASFYESKTHSFYFSYLSSVVPQVREWTYDALVQQDIAHPSLFMEMVQLQLENNTINLWEQLRKHPRRWILKEELQAKNTEKRPFLLRAYLFLGNAQDLSTLFALAGLSEPEENLRHQAIQQIVDTQDCVSILVDLVTSSLSSEITRMAALSQLIRKEQKKCVAFLYELTEPSYPSSLRKYALRWLESFEKENALPQYLSALEDSDTALKKLGAMFVLKYQKKEAIPLFKKLLSDSSWEIVQYAATTLVFLEVPQLSERLVELILPGQPEKNAILLQLLSRLRQTEKEEQIQFFLLDKHLKRYRNLEEIPSYLSQFTHPELLATLEKYCFLPYSQNVRTSAISSLATLYSPRSIQILASIARTQKTEIGSVAIHSLGRLSQQDPQILEQYFRNYLDWSQSPQIRLAATSALKESYQKEAIPILLVALRDKRKEIQDTAQDSLAQLTGQGFTKEKEWQTWWNKNKALNYQSLYLRQKSSSDSLSWTEVHWAFDPHPLKRQQVREKLVPKLQRKIQKEWSQEMLPFFTLSGTQTLFESILENNPSLEHSSRLRLLELLSGQSFTDIQEYQLWWEAVRDQKN